MVSSTRLPWQKTSRAPGSSEMPLVSMRSAGAGGMGLEAAQDGADARGQFARIEGLGQVIVGAEFETDDAVHIFAAGGEHQNGDFGFLAEAAQDFEAIDAWEHDVEHYQIDAGLQGFFEAAVAFMGCFHGKAFAMEELAEQRGEFGVVIDQQDVHGSNLPRERDLRLERAQWVADDDALPA